MMAPMYTTAPWAWTPADALYTVQPAVPLQELAALREDLVGELQAISQYEAHAARATDPRVRDVLLHIARDEREHVVELLELIVAADPVQARVFAGVRRH